jgi:hypothetical protein
VEVVADIKYQKVRRVDL